MNTVDTKELLKKQLENFIGQKVTKNLITEVLTVCLQFDNIDVDVEIENSNTLSLIPNNVYLYY